MIRGTPGRKNHIEHGEKKHMKIFKVYIFILILLTCISFANAQDNTHGFAFLRIGVGGRASGMGEAYTAVGKGAQATFWNPALIKSTTNNSVMISHTEWLEDISSNFLAYSYGKKRVAFGLSLYSNTVSNIEKRSRPTVTPEGVFSANDFFLGVSFSYLLKDNLSIGTTVKYIYQKIYIEDASGYAADLGAACDMLDKKLRIGAVIKNIGSVNILKEEETSLPSLIRIGAAYKINDLSEDIKIITAADFEKVFDGDSYAYFGSEIDYRKKLFLRIGLQSGYDARGFTYGLGVLIKKYQFDYGFQPFSYNLGNTHRISFSYDF